jgi:hypothetical protein
MNNPGSPIDERIVVMARGIMVGVLLMGLVSLEVCRWRIGIPLVIVWVLLIGLGGLLWVLVLNIFGNDHHADDTRQGHLADQHNGGEPTIAHSSSQQPA